MPSRTTYCAALAAAVLIAAPAGATAKVKPADVVFEHGTIYTVDRARSVHRALAVDDGRIVYVGGNRGARRFVGRKTKVIDLRGRMVMPGLEDHHVHPLSGGSRLNECSLNYEALDLAAWRARIAACLDATRVEEPDGWLTVAAWNVQAMKPEGFVPSRADLDALSTQRPILVRGSDGHAALANSRALALAGITRDTPDPPGGRILKDAAGEPTGMLADAAAGLVSEHIPPPTPAENVRALRDGFAALNAQGVTSIWNASGDEATAAAANALKRAGKLTLRANLGYRAQPSLTPARAVRQATAWRRKYADKRLRPAPGTTLRTVKVVADGINQFPAQTGALLEPYLENAGTAERPDWRPGTNRGELYWPPAQLDPLVRAFDKAGWQVHTHCVGDRCTRTALDAYERARRRNGASDKRHTITHIDLAHPDDYDRFAQLGVIASMSFQWGQRDPFFLDASRPYFGEERWKREFPVGSLRRHGARIAWGSDWPVDPLNEWLAMEIAVTRTGPLPGKYAKPLNAAEGIPLAAAVAAFTINSAYQQHQDRVTGSLERGKFADLIVLDRNIFDVPITQVSETKVRLTMVGGKVVYDAQRP